MYEKLMPSGSFSNNLIKQIETSLGIINPTDWYNVIITTNALQFKKTHIKNQEFLYFQNQLKKGNQDQHDTLKNLLSICYPNVFWKIWLFNRIIPKSYWNNKLNQRNFFDNISSNLNIIKPQDWYAITYKNIHSYKKKTTSFPWDSQIIQTTLIELYPEYIDYTYFWKFHRVPNSWWNSLENQRLFLEETKYQFGVNKMEDWYSVPARKVHIKCGFIYQRYDSLCSMLQTIYCNYPFLPWKLSNCPNGYWKNKKNHHFFLVQTSKELGIKKKKELYEVSLADTFKFGAIYKIYGSMFELSSTVFPEINWIPWKFLQVNQNFWDSKENQLSYLNSIEGIFKMEDWYNISPTEISKIYPKYGSMYKLLKFFYPNFNWEPWKFSRIQQNTLNSIKDQKDYLEKLGKKELNINKGKDWYFIKIDDFKKFGATLLRKYNSYPEMLKTIFPDKIWIDWKFSIVPEKTWENQKGKIQRRIFLDKISKKNLGLKIQNQWYYQKNQNLLKYGGSTILLKYNSNLSFCLISLYPEVSFLPWKFGKISDNFWSKDINVLDFLKYCELILDIKEKEDWKYVSFKKFQNLGGNSLVLKMGGISNVISHYFPEIEPEFKNFKSNSNNSTVDKFKYIEK